MEKQVGLLLCPSCGKQVYVREVYNIRRCEIRKNHVDTNGHMYDTYPITTTCDDSTDFFPQCGCKVCPFKFDHAKGVILEK